MTSRRALVLLSGLAALGAPLAAAAAADGLKAGVFDPPRAAPDFALRGSDGGELRLSRHRGKVVLLVFGFTNCPAVCPMTLAVLADARKALGDAAAQAQVVFVTVDPEHDAPPKIRQFLAQFDPTFLGATGTLAQLAAVRASYGVTSRKVDAGFDHSSSVYLIGRDGALRAMMPFGRPAADYVHDVKLLLRS